MKRAPMSPAAMAALGWTRTDPRPWTKLDARWKHRDGWRLEHCGHPTALHPWALYNPDGQMIRTGVLGPYARADYGTAWNDLRSATGYVDGIVRAIEGAR